MLRYAREKDLALFTLSSAVGRPAKPQDLPLRVVVPAYMLSELKAGFEIGAVSLSSVSAGGHGRRLHHHLDRHVPVATGRHLNATQDTALCHGRRLALAGRLAAQEFLESFPTDLKSFERKEVYGNRSGRGTDAKPAARGAARERAGPDRRQPHQLPLSLFQTLTSLQEQTLTTVPRLLIVAAMTLVALPWFARRLVTTPCSVHRFSPLPGITDACSAPLTLKGTSTGRTSSRPWCWPSSASAG